MANTTWVNGRLIGGGKRNPEYQLVAEENLRQEVASLRSRTVTLQTPVAWIGPMGQLMPHEVYAAWSDRYGAEDEADKYRPLFEAAPPAVTLPPMPLPSQGLGVHRWAYSVDQMRERDEYWIAALRAAGVEVKP